MIERLESRRLMSASYVLDNNSGILTISAENGGDTIQLTQNQDGSMHLVMDGTDYGNILGYKTNPDGTFVFNPDGSIATQAVTEVDIVTGNGSDTVNLNAPYSAVTAKISTGNGSDTVIVTDPNASSTQIQIDGGNGNDTIIVNGVSM